MRIPFPMLHRRLRPIALMAALCAFCLCLAPIRLTAAQPLRVCLLLESDVPDKGWHDLLREGLARAAREHHVAARVAVAPAGPEQQDIFRQEAANADLLIVADDSLHEILRNNAAAFPRVRFGCIDIGVRAANIMSVSFADEQAAFLAGVAAAMLTTSDSRGMNPQKTLGWLSGQETGPIVTMLNGFLEGAHLVDPQMRIVHRTVGSFEDAEGARARCREILDEGADIVVLAAGSAGLAALDVLADRNVWMDTSSCMQEIDDDTLRAILRRHPRERLVFGTDYPIMDPQDEIDALQRRTRFTDSELDELLMNGSAMLFG